MNGNEFKELNCCQLCAQMLCDELCIEFTENEYNMLAGFGGGLGVGGICGSLIGVIAISTLALKGEKTEETRLCIIMEFMKRFSTINCGRLIQYQNDNCAEIIKFAVNTAKTAVKNRSNN